MKNYTRVLKRFKNNTLQAKRKTKEIKIDNERKLKSLIHTLKNRHSKQHNSSLNLNGRSSMKLARKTSVNNRNPYSQLLYENNRFYNTQSTQFMHKRRIDSAKQFQEHVIGKKGRLQSSMPKLIGLQEGDSKKSIFNGRRRNLNSLLQVQSVKLINPYIQN